MEVMSPYVILGIVVGYFFLLLSIAYLTGKSDDNQSFFLGNKNAPWFLVAFGMIGSTLSGVTFISVPGWVNANQFSYMQVVFGYLVGYWVIATVLLPLYYRLNLISIYTYLEQRFGTSSYKTGASFFLISRLLGAAFRMYLVAMVFQMGVFDQLPVPIPFWLTAVFTIFLVWAYTFRGGIKTILWTDTLQTTFLLAAVIATIFLIGWHLHLSPLALIREVSASRFSGIFFFHDWHDPRHFLKQFLSGVFLCITLNGLDQDMMQKNLCCRNIREAQKNIFVYSMVLTVVNFSFLCLGALLYIFAQKEGISLPQKADQLFPLLALGGHISTTAGVFFILGLVAATYASADAALTALTTSFCVDILAIQKKEKSEQVRIRQWTHIGVSVALALVIVIFQLLNNESVVSELLTIAGFTYGPLLGLYAFGLFTKWEVQDSLVPLVCILSPLLSYFLKLYLASLGYLFGFELLLFNGALTFVGLVLVRKKSFQ